MKRLLSFLTLLALLAAWGAPAQARQPTGLTKAAAPPPAASPAYNQPPRYFIPKLPAKLSLCGARVPLERPMVAEQLERELIIVVNDPAQVIMWLKRAGRYFPYIQSRLRAAKMPQDLKYLAVAESSLIHYIRSPAGAVGPWQFLAATGRAHGLRVNRWYDDRRNILFATKAALSYLGGLHQEFGSWPLAMAAYNCGERRVGREIKEQGTKDYFDLALPRETQRYIYRILAAKLVLSDPQAYGYYLPPSERWKPLPGESVTLRLRRSTHLTAVARAAGTSYRQMRELNPELRRRYLPKGRVTIVVPPGQAKGLAARLKNGGPSPTPEAETYTVRRGDNLSAIARRHGLTLDEIKDANELEGECIIVPGQRLNIPEK
ncbi:MAG: transglycosylase SLT domain-containing protein [Desulfarculaceae bacterium]|nr:transglycosylase SLT domain-containing protein [Desulfarculaceae bacterium]MCF8047926.1 transglycosylase SLT domain-containing protein [Desulfarculaceae bacterium]MCF8065525.1 transglycosylase SLT domain-containing protein [Desulfarculaceae bacterium]MCF8099128.1 transglycosylase SLT domain-containing protein [Desulfarculaceae bacterium]MCF8124281.1 transglycosylase SLT domain-containing protein [Desulfarculaceae bacterium]